MEQNNLKPKKNQFVLKNRLKVMLVLTGVASSGCIGAGLILKIGNLKGMGMLFAMIYIIVLIWWLACNRPKADDLSDFSPINNLFKSYWVMLLFISILSGLAFILTGIVIGNGWKMVHLSTFLAIVILIALRKKINRKAVLFGIIVFVVSILVELILQVSIINRGIINALLVAFQAVAGILLLDHTGLSKIQFYDGNILKAFRSFCRGCVLAVPPALLNIAWMNNKYLTEFDRQFDQWWKAFYALQPGILEETWARLFLLTLFYALLRPTTCEKPQRAITAALIVSVFIHGLAHYPKSVSDPVAAALTALMYGIPLALIYIKRDFESAVAYHFFVDFARFAFTVNLIS